MDIAITSRDIEEDTNPNITPSLSSEITYELWCGQEKGRITILEMNTLKRMKTLPVKGNDLRNPALNDLSVNFMETVRSFELFNSDKQNASSKVWNVWIVVYPGTQVSRWNVDTRQIEDTFDASQHSPWHDCKSI